ncbi:uncharacterized protein BO87DRAFT_400415 [Aspergillus neoniger CBS 115656]|uniref:Uncharacterized protein n=1 Tax=Aspergillus neoniger (strain CBS 115656) TaxID=1448310 RepID=A0A318YQE8_ASPNB|nr:hypothetical protein BO87DRAFT_400415 [Aspergillus neoniger CBS 115656]PYH30378.1 hypothetical protein BO87DRAFT_400415 [Aspergillus neoniger CBS 115656]
MSCLSLLVLIQALSQISDIQKGTWDMYRTTIVLQGNNTCVSVPNYTHHVIIIILFGLSLTAAASQGRRGSYLLTSLVLLVSNKKCSTRITLGPPPPWLAPSRNIPKSQDGLVRRHHAASGLDQHLLRHSGVLGLLIPFRPADDPAQIYQALLPNAIIREPKISVDLANQLTPSPACNFRHLNEGRLRPRAPTLYDWLGEDIGPIIAASVGVVAESGTTFWPSEWRRE